LYFSYWGKASRAGEPDRLDCHLLPYHSLDVAAVGEALLYRYRPNFLIWSRQLGYSENDFRNFLLFFLSLHDIGKFTAGFQGLRPDIRDTLQGVQAPGRPYSLRHDSIGYLIWRHDRWEQRLEDIFLDEEADSDATDAALDLLQSVSHPFLGHHGMPPLVEPGRLPIVADLPGDLEAALSFLDKVGQLFRPRLSTMDPDAIDEIAQRFGEQSWSLAGFVVLCDWLGSNENYFRFHPEPMPLEDYWDEVARPAAAKAVEATGLFAAEPKADPNFIGLFPKLPDPTPLQAVVGEIAVDDQPRLFCLEDMTGSGKTEASALLVARLLACGAVRGAYFGLPTMATANAMYDRLGACYRRMFAEGETPSLVLAHGARHLHDGFRSSVLPDPPAGGGTYSGEEATAGAVCRRWLAQGNKKSLLAQIGVGTIDQALLGVLPVRHQSLRLLGLADKVLIVDEVHACDAYMASLLESLLTFVASAGGSAILLSATLPAAMRQRMVEAFARGLGRPAPQLVARDYPLLTEFSSSGAAESAVAPREGSERTLEFELVADRDKAIGEVVRACHSGACICWVRNTVRDARDAFERLRDELPDHPVSLFHARYAAGDRLEIEKEVLRNFGPESGPDRRRGRVLVATQVVEQSLDIDFDCMISDLAPLDLLLQRAGRLRRHTRDENGAISASDGRKGSLVLKVLSPQPTDNDKQDWLDETLRSTPWVYRNPRHLWLTAEIVSSRRRISLPEDAREWIEYVFGEASSDLIPPGLQDAVWAAEGQERADVSLAHLNVIDLEKGYLPPEGRWEEDVHAMTRLGESQAVLRLVRCDDDGISPWRSGGYDPWASGDIRLTVPYYGTVAMDDGTGRLMEEFAKDHPCRRGIQEVVPMKPAEDGSWRAELKLTDGKRKRIRYDRELGAELVEA